MKCYTTAYTKTTSTNLTIDDKLIEAARQVGRHKTKEEAVTAALSQYIARYMQLEILSLFGTIDFDPKYNHKAGRRRKPTTTAAPSRVRR